MTLNDESNGVQDPVVFETTGEVEKAVMAAVDSEENTVVALAKLILGSQSNGNGNGNGSGAKEPKRNKWLMALVVLVLGSGGTTAVIYTTSDIAKANSLEVEHLKQLGPRLDKTEEDIGTIQVDLGKIEQSVASGARQTAKVLEGIKSLKEENVNRLVKENEKLERKVRMLESAH